MWHADGVASQQTPDQLRKALASTPTDSTKWTRLGILLLQKEPEAAALAFHRAIELNRYETDAFLGLALQAESAGKNETAESFYLKAIESSRRFKPRYALAAFYSRARRMPEFWQTAVAAAAIDKADVSRVARLARDTGADPDTIPTLLKLRTEHALATYLQTAIAEGRPRPLGEVALRLPPTPEHRPALLAACDRLIQAGASESALAVWNRLGVFEYLDVEAGRSLTNGGFAYSTVQGFNWRQNSLSGIQTQQSVSGLQVKFSGGQPEHAVVLEQIAPVLPSRKYRLAVRSETTDLPAASGLSWYADCVPSKSPSTSSAERIQPTGTTILEIFTSRDCRLARLALLYDRQPGTVRIEGTLDLVSARLDLLP